MSILDRILGRTPAEGPQIRTAAKPPKITELPATAVVSREPVKAAPLAPAADEPVVRVYDQFGRSLTIGREAWRKDVLLPNLATTRDPEALYDLIVTALNDDFAPDVLDAARHLAATHPEPRRAAALLGAVLLQVRDHDGARAVLEEAITRHGSSSYLLSSLARALAALGDEQRAEALIWQALELDPNEPTSLNWLIASVSAKGGQQAVLAAYARAAAFAGSWRPQLWLARDALARGDTGAATSLYDEVLGRVRPVPGELLAQLSGDLGNRGQAALLVRLTQPHFDVATHGLAVGNNLMRAYAELGSFAEARKLLEQLYAQQRPEWREPLGLWEQKLDDAQKRYGEVTAPLDIVLMRLEQPVWARGTLGFDAVLPAKSASAPRIHFICGSGEAREDSGNKVISQPTNDLGRLTRALPMFFAEELFLRTNARTAFLLPWLKQGGFIVSARPWTRAFLPPDNTPPDLFVYLHVDARESPWLLRVTIENAQRDAPPVFFEQAFSLETAGRDVLTLLNDLVPRLTILLALRREDTGSALAMPAPEQVPGYLAGLEQALAVGLAARQPNAENFLHQERSIFDHLFEVALNGGQLLRPRMLLVNTLENQSRRRPDMVREYLDRLALLQQQSPLAEGTGSNLVEKGVRTVTDKSQPPAATG